MAKKSMIAKNKQRQEIVARYAAKRAELKKALVDPNGTDESLLQLRTLGGVARNDNLALLVLGNHALLGHF